MNLPILEILIISLTLCVTAYGWICLPTKKLKILFVCSVVLLSIYKLYDPVFPDSFDDIAYVWARHAFFYVGELLFYIFIVNFSRHYIEIEDESVKPSKVSLGIVPVPLFGGAIPWFHLLTEQGLPHVLALPLFVLIISLIRLRLAVFTSPYMRVARLFSFAVGAWVLIHISEFAVESQKVIPGLEEQMAYIEFGWFLVGSLIFMYAMYSLKQMNHVKSA